MIKLIVGHKGLGKTKTLIEMANSAVDSSKGNVVCIEKGVDLTYNLNHDARLIDIDEYAVENFDGYYGFISGLLAGNYDITHIFCDGVFKVCGKDIAGLEKLLDKLSNLECAKSVEIVMLVSCEPEELSDNAKALIINK